MPSLSLYILRGVGVVEMGRVVWKVVVIGRAMEGRSGLEKTVLLLAVAGRKTRVRSITCVFNLRFKL